MKNASVDQPLISLVNTMLMLKTVLGRAITNTEKIFICIDPLQTIGMKLDKVIYLLLHLKFLNGIALVS